MKKLILILLAAVTVLCLCACGAEETGGEEMQITAKPKTEQTVPEETTVPVSQPEQTGDESTKKALAEALIGEDISKLYEAIGEPERSDYAPSCLVEGEDGMLYYDGFIVYTTREGDVETVYDVE